MMKKGYLLFLAALAVILGYGCSGNIFSEESPIVNAENDSENLLKNPSFESTDKMFVEEWESEYTTYGVPSYYTSTTGLVDGSLAQQIYYQGFYDDASREGKNFLEIFQLVENVHPGDKLKFSVYISGSLVKTPAVVGIEGFNSSHEYIYLSESNSYVTRLSKVPRLYEVTYECPNDTDCVAVYFQCQEIIPGSKIEISLDNARLVRLPPEHIEPIKNDLDEKAMLAIYFMLLVIPSTIILSEVTIRLKGRAKRYSFSGHKNDNYQILVPIWGKIKYLENVEYLSKYGPRVTLCTTGNGLPEFYESLNDLAARYGFNVFIDETSSVDSREAGTNERTTSGNMRDTIIRNALKKVLALYVVTLDADSITDEDMSILVGELEHRQLDIASIRIAPSNGEKSLLTKLQVFEYEIAMDFRYLCPWLISGACHCAKTCVLKDIMERHSLFFQGNDVETGLLAKTIGYRVGHIPFMVRTSVPEDIGSWTRQRLAWAGGEFRLYVINLKFIVRHPFFWFYGAIITIGLFPLRWIALSVLTPSLYIILALYIALTFYVHWKNINKCLFLMPFYTLFISVVIVPLGVIWYLYMAYRDKNYGIIDSRKNIKITG